MLRWRLGLIFALAAVALAAFACGVDLIGTPDATTPAGTDAGVQESPNLPQPGETLDGGSLGVPDAEVGDAETPLIDSGASNVECGAPTLNDNFANGIGQWTQYGDVTQGIQGSNGYARLIQLNTPGKAAGLFWVPTVNATAFKATFSYYARTYAGSGGDGLTLTWLTAKDAAALGTGVVSGQTLGIPPNVSGYAFAFDAFRNNSITDPPSPSFSILKIDGAQPPGNYAWHVKKSGPWSYVFDSWREVIVTVRDGKLTATVTGTAVFTNEPIDTTTPIVAIGFTASTGGADPIAFFVDTVSIAFENATCN
jgi:hypothetical protein